MITDSFTKCPVILSLCVLRIICSNWNSIEINHSSFNNKTKIDTKRLNNNILVFNTANKITEL